MTSHGERAVAGVARGVREGARLTRCGTRWGKGSDWENATWFDYPDHEALPVFEWLHHKYRRANPGERG